MSAHGYGLDEYGRMVTHGPRWKRWSAALRQAIAPDAHVLEIGTGPGFFALLACQLGAERVVAIEPDPSIEIAREAARRNGVEDRITFVRGLSTDYVPERKADVIISDIKGVMPLYSHHIPCIVDARARLLAPGGQLLAGRDRIHAALVQAPQIDAEYRDPWRAATTGVDLGAAEAFALNQWRRVCLGPSHLLTEPALFAELHYAAITETNHRNELRWQVGRAGCAHGILMWFETEIVPGITLSNAPGEPEMVYGQAFFPLQQPVLLEEGAEARAEISANLIDGDYIWSWAFSAVDASGQDRRFRQSAFKGTIPDMAKLASRAAGFRPPARAIHEVDAFCLSQFDGETTLEAIAEALLERFPDRFGEKKAALGHVASLSERYAS